MPAGLRFYLLGPLAVERDAAVVPVNAGMQRALLAVLLLNAGRVVSVDELAEALWGASPPPSARVSVQNLVSRLRRVLGDGGHSLIASRPPGYLVTVDADELDVSRFEALLASARTAARAGSWDQSAAQATAALALWRGEPLEDVESDALGLTEVPRLQQMRLQAVETRIDADLHRGRHADVVVELERLVAAYPLRERFHAQLMAALYGSGRQADALAVYQQARSALVEELGAEPAAELRDLHQRILAGDPALTLTVPGAQAAAVPRQLPATVPGFTGRAAELAALTAMLDQAGGPGTIVISAIGGTAGVGKTALAIHWAHQVANNFPDGQLHMNLRGFDPSGTPATPETAIRGFLDALDVPPERIPADPQAQAGLYRSLLAGKRMLIVLDNAVDEQQVRPLLPASPASLVIVTSRNQLAGLAAADAARLITLDVLSHVEAVQMLTTRLGTDRATAEPGAVEEIASLCAYLPLALAVAAARAAARPGFPLTALADGLAESGGRLDVLDAGDPVTSIRAVFSWSTRQLSGAAARMLRLLGLHPGPDISVPAAASLAAVAEPRANRLLGELARAHLIEENVPGRYSMHDLLRAYAAEQANAHDSQDDRNAAVGRALDYYLHTAARAALLLNPAREPVVLAPARSVAAAGQPADRRQANAGVEAEHQVLLAAISLAAGSGFDSHAWQLPWAIADFLQIRGHWQDWTATAQTALAAATRLGDTAAQALSGRILANAHRKVGDHEQASDHYASSLRLYQRLGDRRGEAGIQQNLGVLAGAQGRYADALAHAEQALRLYQATGDKVSEVNALNAVGWYHALLGDYRQGRVFCRRALTLCAATGHRWFEGSVWDSLGYAEHHLGNLVEAADCYQRALGLFREFGDRFGEAGTLTRLGDTRHAAGLPAQARQQWQQALAILDDLQHPNADQVRAKLAATHEHASRTPSA
jgi:DNA-binding SARP family transcriptional activator/tetratricopeptide (TPR) repeat protein